MYTYVGFQVVNENIEEYIMVNYLSRLLMESIICHQVFQLELI